MFYEIHYLIKERFLISLSAQGTKVLNLSVCQSKEKKSWLTGIFLKSVPKSSIRDN